MKTKTQIVLPDGQATRDDVLSVALLLAYSRGQIERIHRCSFNQLNDDTFRTSIVLSFGERKISSEHMWLNQNQAEDPICATSLVLRCLGLIDTAAYLWPWLAAMDQTWGKDEPPHGFGRCYDCRKQLLTHKQWEDLRGPVEKWLLDWFSGVEESTVPHGCSEKEIWTANPLYGTLSRLGRYMLTQLRRADADLKTICEHVEVLKVNAHQVLFVTVVPGWVPARVEAALRHYCYDQSPRAIAAVSPDENQGSKLHRFPDKGYLLNFSRLKRRPGIVLARENLAKTNNTLTPEMAKVLIREAFIPQTAPR